MNQIPNIYSRYDFDTIFDPMINNRLFCTFSPSEEIESTLYSIQSRYEILYKKIFIFRVASSDEYAITYNVEQGNIDSIPDNTMFIHRKKEFNVLYSLNGLNEVIRKSNNGVVDPSFKINWQFYKNNIILTRMGELAILKTKLHDIIEV